MKKASVLALVIFIIVSFQTTHSEYWEKTSIPSVEIKALAFCDNNDWAKENALIAITIENKIYRLIFDYYDFEKNLNVINPTEDSIEYTAIAAYGSDIYLGTNKKGIFYSSDMGNTWLHITENIGNEVITSFAYDYHVSYPNNDTTIYNLTGTKNGLYISYSKSLNWTKMDNELKNKEIHKIFVYETYNYINQIEIFVSTNDSNVYIARNINFNFEKTTFPENIKGIINSICSVSSEYYAISENELFTYDIFKKNWHIDKIDEQPKQMNSILTFDFRGIIYSLDNKKNKNKITTFPKLKEHNLMIGSLDKGIMIYSFIDFYNQDTVWKDANDSLNDRRITTLISSNPYNNNFLFAGTKSDGVYKIHLILSEVDFSNNTPPDFTIINNNDQFIKLKLNLTNDDFINLELYDLQGNKLKGVYKDYLSEGTHILDLDIRDLQSGIYFIKLQMNGRTTVKKMLVAW